MDARCTLGARRTTRCFITPPPCLRARSAPLPIKVDGFSVGAVMGYTEQHTVICLATDSDIQAFLKASLRLLLEPGWPVWSLAAFSVPCDFKRIKKC